MTIGNPGVPSSPPSGWKSIITCKSDFNTGALWWTQRTPFRLGSLCHRFARREAVASVPKGRSYSQFLAAKAASEKPSQATVRVDGVGVWLGSR